MLTFLEGTIVHEYIDFTDSITLGFSFPADYPDVGPEIEIMESVNFDDIDELELMSNLEELVQENLGTVMVFTLASSALDWMNNLKDRKKTERIEEALRRKKELEELEHQRFEGTRVTVESFISWKLKFEEEMANLKKAKKVDANKKLTGKEMFLRDRNLASSDLNFGDDDDTDFNVDESLFEGDELIDELGDG